MIASKAEINHPLQGEMRDTHAHRWRRIIENKDTTLIIIILLLLLLFLQRPSFTLQIWESWSETLD